MAIIQNGVGEGGQFVIATHSPLLMAYPDAPIFEIDEHEISRRTFDEVASVQLWKAFFNSPNRVLRHLFND